MSSTVFRTGLACILFAACGTARADTAMDSGGQLAVLTGSFHVRAPANDDLVDCAHLPSARVVDTQLVASALPGICDDLGTQPCQGEMRVQIQRCVAGGVALSAGPLSGAYSLGVARICHVDPTLGVAGCTSANTVAKGSWTAAGSSLPSDVELRGTGVLSIHASRRFAFDTAKVRASRQRLTYQFVSERSSPTPGSCGVTPAGCGFVATGAR